MDAGAAGGTEVVIAIAIQHNAHPASIPHSCCQASTGLLDRLKDEVPQEV